MAFEIGAYLEKSIVIGIVIFIVIFLGYLVGLHKPFILMKHKKKLGEAKVFMAALNQRLPPSKTMEPNARMERSKQMIKSGFPNVVLAKAQQLVAQDIKKQNREVSKNGLRLQKTKPSGTSAGDTGSTIDTGATSGNGSISGSGETQQSGLLPISQAPIRSGKKPPSQWDWNTIKSNRTDS